LAQIPEIKESLPYGTLPPSELSTYLNDFEGFEFQKPLPLV
jgi:hypothetical protein